MVGGITDDLAREVMAEPGGERLLTCLSCGTCTAACPVQWWNPAYNPRRILRQIALGQREVLRQPTIWFCSACDQCYRRCPEGLHLSELMQAIRAVAQRSGIVPGRGAAHVDERLCAGCGRCVEVCPYRAVALAPRRVLGADKVVAVVDGARCLQCGLCQAGCRCGAIAIPAFADRELCRRVRFGLGEPLPPLEARP